MGEDELLYRDQTIYHTQYGAGLTGTRCHGEQNILLTVQNSIFSGLNGFQLVFPEIQAVFRTRSGIAGYAI